MAATPADSPTAHSPAELYEWAAYWSQHWFLDEQGRDRLALPFGIDGGWATHVEAYEALTRFALAEGGLSGRAGTDTSLPGRLKSRGIDRSIRAWGLRALNRGDTAHLRPGGVAAIVEIPTPSAFGPLREVAARLPPEMRSLAAADPRAARAWRQLGARPHSLVLGLREERGALATGRQAAAAAFHEVFQGPPTMALGVRDVSQSALSDLRSLLARGLAWLAPEAIALRRFLDAVQPLSIALATDQHRIGRMTVQLAYDTPVVVIQHGLPQARIGYLPVVANRVAVWSRASFDWFAGHGTPPERLVITGNPRFDALIGMDRDSARRQVVDALRLAGTPRLLLALSPTDIEVNSAVLHTTLDALASLRQAVLVIKLHPGHRNWRFVRALVADSPDRDRVRVLHREPLEPLLGWADVLLVHRSTVAAEALAAGTPVVLVGADAEAGEDTRVPPELRDLDLPHIRRDVPAADMLADLAAGDSRLRFIVDRGAHIERLNGPADGRSAERIARLLLSQGDPASVSVKGQAAPPAASTAPPGGAAVTGAGTPSE